jgi:hypothetical protein
MDVSFWDAAVTDLTDRAALARMALVSISGIAID